MTPWTMDAAVRVVLESAPLLLGASVRETPVYRRQPGGGFELSGRTEIDWAMLAALSLRSASADPSIERLQDEVAAKLEGRWLGAPVRESLPRRTVQACIAVALEESLGREVSPPLASWRAGEMLGAFLGAERIRFVCRAPLSGVRIGAPPVQLSPGVHLVRMDEGDRRHAWSRLAGRFSYVGGGSQIDEVAAAQAAIEVRLEVSERDGRSWVNLHDRLERAAQACQLAGPGAVGLLGSWIEPLEHFPFADSIAGLGVTRPLRAIGAPRGAVYTVAAADSSGVAELYERLGLPQRGLEEDQLAGFELALRRFRSTYDRRDDKDRLIDAWIALEALFLADGGGELSYRATMRIARFLGATAEERADLRRQLASLYRARSAVVHGASPKGHLPVLAEDTVEILRRALRGWLDPERPCRPDDLDRALLG